MLFLLLPLCVNAQQPPTKQIVTVGIAAVENTQTLNIGFSVCGGAIPLALEYLRKEGHLLNVDFRFYVNYTECDPSIAVSVGMDFVNEKKVDAIIGPPCPATIRMMGMISTYYKKFMMVWGYATDAEFGYVETYPNMAVIMPNSRSLGYVTLEVLEKYQWSRVSVIYTTTSVGYCKSLVEGFELALADSDTYQANVVLKREIPKSKPNDYISMLNTAKSRSRIFLLCFNLASETREFFYRVNDLGMTSDEYVYIIMSMKSNAFGQTGTGHTSSSDSVTTSGMVPFWEDIDNNNEDGKDEAAKSAARKALAIDLSALVDDQPYLSKFMQEVVPRVRQPPISCNTPACLNNTGQSAGGFSRHLHDAFYLYGRSLEKSIEQDPLNGYKSPELLQDNVQMTFNGLTGDVTMNSNTTRTPVYLLYALDSKYDEIAFFNITYINSVAKITDLPAGGDSAMWSTRGGKIPLSRPICGYLGTECPKEFWDQNGIFVIIGAALIGLFVIILILVLIFTIKSRRREKERLNAEWQISSNKLMLPPKKARDHLSRPSLRSDPSTMTGDSRMTTTDMVAAKYYDLYILEKDPVLVTEHEPALLSANDGDFFIKLRKIDHLNLNNFIGVSLDGVDYKVIWKYCSRSSLQDLIASGNMNNSADSFFVFCVIRDLAEALLYLHSSFVGCHGRLYSGCCLVNDGWQVKVSDFGLHSLSNGKKVKDRALLWKAPEHLRSGGESQAGDIYSFAIIASEIINRKPAWNAKERKESLDELLYLVKKGGMRPIRPEFDSDDLELSPAIYALVKDCWNEEPGDRPNAENIRKLLRSIVPNEKLNLIDHVFNKLEEYTSTLEVEVEDRTKELVVEKKKADTLLSKMLPKQVAEKLKLGQTVEPEGFDSVTVMFMDIVKFTQLAAKCSPFQVVNLLNELYSNYDNIIEQHDVYKVESIGDGYLCVSGLPARNGFQHIKEIVDMCIIIREYIQNFRISHLPNERIQQRFGINSGPCVAGVVGLSMPRYCLFGDTVNTASRMESNGKADHIHMSAIAHITLIDHFPGQYATESRGDVIIKGKGVMETFWVIGRAGANGGNSNSSPSMNIKSVLSPQSSFEKPEQKSVDDYVIEEPLYRHYSKQTTMKAEEN